MNAEIVKATSSSASVPERCFMVFVLVLCTGAFLNVFFMPEHLLDSGTGMPEFRALWAAIYLVALIFSVRRCRGSLRLLLAEWPVVLLVGFAILSALWSTSPGVTLRRSIGLIGTGIIAAYFACRFTLREQLKLLVVSSGICVFFSFLFGLFHWGRSVDDLEGVWYGIYTQRNQLGSMMALSALVFFLWGASDRQKRLLAGFLALCTLGLIALSGSMTSLIAFFALVLSFPLAKVLRFSKKAGWVLALLVVGLGATAVWTVKSIDTVTEAMGREPSLTGRAEIWASSSALGLERPWLGYGYNAFWLGLEGPSAEVWQIVGWAVPGAHNGLLETWLDLGLIGLTITVVGFVSYFGKAYRVLRRTAEWECAWPLLFLVLLSIQNLTESSFLSGNSIYWLLYVVIALDLSLLETREHELEVSPARISQQRLATEPAI